MSLNDAATASSATSADRPDSPEGTRLQLMDVARSEAPAYVQWEAVSLQHFVNRYIRTRHRPVNRENRLVVQQAMARYRGSFPARCQELEAFLDGVLQLPKP